MLCHEFCGDDPYHTFTYVFLTLYVSLPLCRYSEDKHSLLKASHLISDDPAHQAAVVLQDACPVCLVGADECNMTSFSLGCRHTFCSECWLEYISDKVTAGVATGEQYLLSLSF